MRVLLAVPLLSLACVANTSLDGSADTDAIRRHGADAGRDAGHAGGDASTGVCTPSNPSSCSTCGEGAAPSSGCLCGGERITAGFCCRGAHQTTRCTGELIISSALSLDKSTVRPGETLTATVAYQNTGAAGVTVNSVVISCLPPGTTVDTGPFFNMAPALSSTVVAPGSTLPLTASITFSPSEPTGQWQCNAVFQDAAGAWHGGPFVPFRLEASGGSDASIPADADASAPPPEDAGRPDGSNDTTPPAILSSAPSGTLPRDTTSATLEVVTDENAQCKWDNAASTPFASMANTFAVTGRLDHQSPLTGLSNGQSYTFYVRCMDGHGNAATSSYSVSFTVASAQGNILWHDEIQTGSGFFGFQDFHVEHPIGTVVTPSDANGASLGRVADPLAGGGFALRHYGLLTDGGSRAQACIYGDVNTAFGAQAKRPEGVWVAMEWYFPEVLKVEGSSNDERYWWPWLAMMDFHAISMPSRANRWWGSPGLFVARDGSMKIEVGWSFGSGPQGKSTIPMPVGRWFDIEVHYQWTDTPTGTFTVWIDGQLALEQQNVQTHNSSQGEVEMYLKLYGDNQGGPNWLSNPTAPVIKYTRNVRIAGERIWR